jgi:hypothetical protein
VPVAQLFSAGKHAGNVAFFDALGSQFSWRKKLEAHVVFSGFGAATSLHHGLKYIKKPLTEITDS